MIDKSPLRECYQVLRLTDTYILVQNLLYYLLIYGQSCLTETLYCFGGIIHDVEDLFLKETNLSGVMTRPIWQLMFRLPMFQNCFKDSQKNAIFLEERIINIPSSVR